MKLTPLAIADLLDEMLCHVARPSPLSVRAEETAKRLREMKVVAYLHDDPDPHEREVFIGCCTAPCEKDIPLFAFEKEPDDGK